MIILEIKPRRKQLMALVLSPGPEKDEFRFETDSTGLLVLDGELCTEKGITAGRELSFDELKSLVSESYYRRAKHRALWYLSRGDLSKRELTEKLKKICPKEIAEKVAERMTELGYINDERYARRLAESYLKAKRVAPRRAAVEMAAKGIERETVREALGSVEADSVEIICELIEKKYKNKLSDPDSQRKTVAALCRRGFSFSDIRAAIKKYNLELEYTED